jgi:chemotaxis signal transduction protein
LLLKMGKEDLDVGVQEPVTGSPSSASPSRFLIVALGGRHLALDAESIWGVLTLEEAGNVDDPTIHGMANGAVNLADRWSLSNDQDGANTRVVLLSEREARGSLRVTAVQGLLEIPQSQVLPLPMQFRGPERYWYRGMVLFAKSIALVLNTTWVLDEQVSSQEG